MLDLTPVRWIMLAVMFLVYIYSSRVLQFILCNSTIGRDMNYRLHCALVNLSINTCLGSVTPYTDQILNRAVPSRR